MAAGGASASGMGRDLRGQAEQARAARQAGERVQRGRSETAYRRQAKAWDAGAVGEERAARQLDRLRRYGYTVLHDRLLEPPKPWNLDHVVIGPAGIYFVDAKNWRGRISIFKGRVWRHWYGGPKTGKQSEPMDREVTKVREMAAHAAQRMGCRVIPVIALAGQKSREFEGIETVDGVRIISVDGIVPWLRDSPERIPADRVRMWTEIAERVFPPAVKEEPSGIASDFEAFSAAVRGGPHPTSRDTPATPSAPATVARPPAAARPAAAPARPAPSGPARPPKQSKFRRFMGG